MGLHHRRDNPPSVQLSYLKTTFSQVTKILTLNPIHPTHVGTSVMTWDAKAACKCPVPFHYDIFNSVNKWFMRNAADRAQRSKTYLSTGCAMHLFYSEQLKIKPICPGSHQMSKMIPESWSPCLLIKYFKVQLYGIRVFLQTHICWQTPCHSYCTLSAYHSTGFVWHFHSFLWDQEWAKITHYYDFLLPCCLVDYKYQSVSFFLIVGVTLMSSW